MAFHSLRLSNTKMSMAFSFTLRELNDGFADLQEFLEGAGMIIYPAIDLRGGKVVRLKEGDPSRQTIFSEDPVATAQKWIAQGASWIHIVNLDGAFAERTRYYGIPEAVAQFGVKVQFGGGLRTLPDIELGT